MSAVPNIWRITDAVCDKHGIGGESVTKNSNVKPQWSYTTAKDEIKVVESEFANFKLVWNGKVVAHAKHPADLLRWAYAKHLVDVAKVAKIAEDLGINPCHVYDNDR